MTLLHILLSIAFAYMATSVIEYAVHRWLMHRMRIAKSLGSAFLQDICHDHMAIHHKREYRHTSKEPDDNIFLVSLVSALPAVGVASMVYFLDPITTEVMIAFDALYSILWWLIHLEMHRHEGRFFSRTALYRYLERQHQLHHQFASTNFNLILPFADWVFGTLPTKEQIKRFTCTQFGGLQRAK